MTDIEILLLGGFIGFIARPYVDVMIQIFKNAWKKTNKGD